MVELTCVHSKKGSWVLLWCVPSSPLVLLLCACLSAAQGRVLSGAQAVIGATAAGRLVMTCLHGGGVQPACGKVVLSSQHVGVRSFVVLLRVLCHSS